jgi:hypothetical protein
MVQHVKGNLDGVELHLVVVVRPGFRNVVRLNPDRDQERSADEHAGYDTLATLKSEAFR